MDRIFGRGSIKDVHARSRKKRERLTRLRLEIEHQSSENHELKTPITDEQGHNETYELPFEESNKIRENIIFLKDELDPDNFIYRLFSDGILTTEQQEELKAIMNIYGREKCTGELLNILSRGDPKSYAGFCECLKKERYFLALKKLQPNEDITKDELKRSRGKIPEPEYGTIQRNMMVIKQDICPANYITHLFTKQVFTEDEYNRLKTIENNKGKIACVEAMLYTLLRCGQHGYKQLILFMQKENPCIIRKLYPDNSTSSCKVKYPKENHEVILDLEREEHTEFKNRTIQYLEETLNEELPGKQLVSICSLTKGCVQVTFEILSLDKTAKDKLHAVLEKAVQSGHIGPDSVAEEFTFQSVQDDDLTDAEVDAEIRRLEEVKMTLNEEHGHLLSLRKNPKTSAIRSGVISPPVIKRGWTSPLSADLEGGLISSTPATSGGLIQPPAIKRGRTSPTSYITSDLKSPRSAIVGGGLRSSRLVSVACQVIPSSVIAGNFPTPIPIPIVGGGLTLPRSAFVGGGWYHGISQQLGSIEEETIMLKQKLLHKSHSSLEESAAKKDEIAKHLENIEEDIGKLISKMKNKPYFSLVEFAPKAEILQKLNAIDGHMTSMRTGFVDFEPLQQLRRIDQHIQMLRFHVDRLHD